MLSASAGPESRGRSCASGVAALVLSKSVHVAHRRRLGRRRATVCPGRPTARPPSRRSPNCCSSTYAVGSAAGNWSVRSRPSSVTGRTRRGRADPETSHKDETSRQTTLCRSSITSNRLNFFSERLSDSYGVFTRSGPFTVCAVAHLERSSA